MAKDNAGECENESEEEFVNDRSLRDGRVVSPETLTNLLYRYLILAVKFSLKKKG